MNKLLLSLLFVFCYNHCADGTSKNLSTTYYESYGSFQDFGWLDNDHVCITVRKKNGKVLVCHKKNGWASTDSASQIYRSLTAKTFHKTKKENNKNKMCFYQEEKKDGIDTILIKETTNHKPLLIGKISFANNFERGKREKKNQPSWSPDGGALAIPLVHKKLYKFAICIAQLQPKSLAELSYSVIKKATYENKDATAWKWMQTLNFVKELKNKS